MKVLANQVPRPKASPVHPPSGFECTLTSGWYQNSFRQTGLDLWDLVQSPTPSERAHQRWVNELLACWRVCIHVSFFCTVGGRHQGRWGRPVHVPPGGHGRPPQPDQADPGGGCVAGCASLSVCVSFCSFWIVIAVNFFWKSLWWWRILWHCGIIYIVLFLRRWQSIKRTEANPSFLCHLVKSSYFPPRFLFRIFRNFLFQFILVTSQSAWRSRYVFYNAYFMNGYMYAYTQIYIYACTHICRGRKIFLSWINRGSSPFSNNTYHPCTQKNTAVRSAFILYLFTFKLVHTSLRRSSFLTSGPHWSSTSISWHGWTNKCKLYIFRGIPHFKNDPFCLLGNCQAQNQPAPLESACCGLGDNLPRKETWSM